MQVTGFDMVETGDDTSLRRLHYVGVVATVTVSKVLKGLSQRLTSLSSSASSSGDRPRLREGCDAGGCASIVISASGLSGT